MDKTKQTEIISEEEKKRDELEENENKELSPEQKKTRRNKIIAGVLGLLAVVIIALLLIVNCTNWFDPNAQEGYYSGKTTEEIQADLDREVREGEMNCSIAHTVKFNEGTDNPGLARIENIANNPVDQKVRIVMSDGREMYASDAIAPGYYIEYIDSKVSLEPGLYKATAEFTGYNRETHRETGRLAGEIVIEVK